MTNDIKISRELAERLCKRPGKESLAVNHADILDRGAAQAELRALLSAPVVEALVIPLSGPKEWLDSHRAAPVVERQDGSALMKIAADLANRHPLRQLYLVCERQGRINTDSLHEHLDKCGDLLAGIALDIRRAITSQAAPVVDSQELAGYVSFIGNGFVRVRTTECLTIEQPLFTSPPAPVEVVPHRYTCIGKGGEYELLGSAIGAGTLKDMSAIPVYRDTTTGQLFVRTPLDFATRMDCLDNVKELNQ